MPTGSCLCSAIHYTYTGPPQVTALCHCLDCQKWSGGAYTSNIVVPRKDFKVSKGKPKNYVLKGDSGEENDHWFCGGTLLPFLSCLCLMNREWERLSGDAVGLGVLQTRIKMVIHIAIAILSLLYPPTFDERATLHTYTPRTQPSPPSKLN